MRVHNSRILDRGFRTERIILECEYLASDKFESRPEAKKIYEALMADVEGYDIWGADLKDASDIIYVLSSRRHNKPLHSKSLTHARRKELYSKYAYKAKLYEDRSVESPESNSQTYMTRKQAVAIINGYCQERAFRNDKLLLRSIKRDIMSESVRYFVEEL